MLAAVSKKTPTTAALAVFFLSVYVFTMSGRIQYGDEIEKYRVAQSIVENHGFSFRPTVMRNYPGTGGRTFSIYEMGQSLVEVPLYLVGKTANGFFPQPDANSLAMLFVGLLNPILTTLSVLVLFRLCILLGFSHRVSLALALAYGLATIAWPYSKGFTREPLLTLLMLVGVYAVCLFSSSRRDRWLMGAGLAAGFLAYTKFIQAMVVPFLVVYIGAVIVDEQRRKGGTPREVALRTARGVGLFFLPVIVFLALQSTYSLLRFGTPFAGFGTRGNPADWILGLVRQSHPDVAIVGLFFSLEKSIFVYSPPVLLSVFGWFRWLGKKRKEALLFLGLVAIEFVSVIVRPDWDGGSWWGPRYLVQIIPLLIVPIGALLEWPGQALGKAWWAALGVLSAAGVVVQAVGAVTNTRDYLDITGRGAYLLGQLDFVRHGLVDSLLVYLSPADLSARLNPLGIVLALGVLSSGVLLFWSARGTREEGQAKRRWGFAFATAVWVLELAAFTGFLVAPYDSVSAAQSDTAFAAAGLFLADGRRCEATALYVKALDRGTNFTPQAVARLDDLLPRVQGISISADDLAKQVEMPDTASVSTDGIVTISGEGSLRMGILGQKDATIMATAPPLAVSPNASYQISGWIRTLSVYGSGYATVEVFEDDGNWANGRTTEIKALDETHGWEPFRKTITTRPTTKRLFVKASLWKTYGKVWIDGLQFAPVAGPDLVAADPGSPCGQAGDGP